MFIKTFQSRTLFIMKFFFVCVRGNMLLLLLFWLLLLLLFSLYALIRFFTVYLEDLWEYCVLRDWCLLDIFPVRSVLHADKYYVSFNWASYRRHSAVLLLHKATPMAISVEISIPLNIDAYVYDIYTRTKLLPSFKTTLNFHVLWEVKDIQSILSLVYTKISVMWRCSRSGGGSILKDAKTSVKSNQ